MKKTKKKMTVAQKHRAAMVLKFRVKSRKLTRKVTLRLLRVNGQFKRKVADGRHQEKVMPVVFDETNLVQHEIAVRQRLKKRYGSNLQGDPDNLLKDLGMLPSKPCLGSERELVVHPSEIRAKRRTAKEVNKRDRAWGITKKKRKHKPVRRKAYSVGKDSALQFAQSSYWDNRHEYKSKTEE